jgi:subtilisin
MRIIEPKFLRRWVKHLKARRLYRASGVMDCLCKARREGRPLTHEEFFGTLRENLSWYGQKKLYLSALRTPHSALAREAFFELDERPKKRLIVHLKPDIAQKHVAVGRAHPTPHCDCVLCQCGALTLRTLSPMGRGKVGGKGEGEFPYIAIGCLAKDADALCHHPDVEFAEEDGRVELVGALDDTVSPTGDKLTWGYRRIKADHAYGFGLRGQGVKVAVLDTGIDYTHEDLKALYKGGYDFANEDADPIDDHWHGTHVAGIIASVANGVGYRGVAPMIDLYAVKVLFANGVGYWSDLAAGINWCRQNGIKIINMSLGGYTLSQAVKDACDLARAEGITLVAAAGNAGSAWGADLVSYPARFDSVITVTATMVDTTDYPAGTPLEDMKATMPSFASIGPSVDFGAPGAGINSTVPLFRNPSGYAQANGTSMASPHVAGLCASLQQAAPTATPDQIKQWLVEVAVPEDMDYIHPGWNSPNPHPFRYLGNGEVRMPSAGTLASILQQPSIVGRNRIPLPYVLRYPSPQNGQTNVPVGNPIRFTLKSDTWGIDLDKVKVKVTDSNGVNTYDSTSPYFSYVGTRWGYEIEVRPPQPWANEEAVQVEIEAEDFMGTPGVMYEYVP